jgi:hypothetical protein
MIYYKYHPTYFFFTGSEDALVQPPNSTPVENLPYSFGNDSIFVPPSKSETEGHWEYTRNQQGYEYDALSPARQAAADIERNPNSQRLKDQLAAEQAEADAVALAASFTRFSTPVQELLDQEFAIPACLARIDAAADQLIHAVIGNRGIEYTVAEAEALQYTADNYTGDAPHSIESWSDASGLTLQGATENILAKAAQWRGISRSLRSSRLLAKHDILS